MSAVQAVLAGKVFSPWPLDGLHTIHIHDGQVASIEDGAARFGISVLDARDAIVVPGLIDLQVNGALGWSFQAADRDHFDEIARFHASRGTTTFLPTLVTAPEEVLIASLSVLANWIPSSTNVALPGIHLEGPFLSPEKSGAHDPAFLRLPDRALLARFLAASQGRIRIVTLAPELPGAGQLIEDLVSADVVASGGHSAGRYSDFEMAVKAGLTFLTHIGNASDWPHRALNDLGFLGSEPGMVGAWMAIPDLSGSLIMDGFHFHPTLLKPLLQIKGSERLVLISDAAPVTGLPFGEYESGGLKCVIHPEGFATSGRGGGWLAGSVITLLEGVQRAVQLSGISLTKALAMAAQNPARLLGLQGRKGEIRPGADADMLVLNQDLTLRQVVIRGQLLR